MTTQTVRRPAYYPAVPESIEELGIPKPLVFDLILRRVYTAGLSNFRSLAAALRISPIIVEGIFRELRSQQLVEVRTTTGDDYDFTLSAAGRTMALERFQISHYNGPAPVSLDEYMRATRTQKARVQVSRAILKEKFSDLVIPDYLLDQLGPAIVGHKSIFLYGPPGNGKTSIAERLLRCYEDAILLPHAVEVDGQIIVLYDPVVHERVDTEDDPDLDPRWIVCRRPLVIAGGELVSSMLELKLDPGTNIYAAPLQMKANNGIFVIDDFGRQLMAPRELLNRWIVPLDRRVDYLALRHGVKFQIPFELMVVFSTNLNPSELADEAFLRRIQNKVRMEPVSPENFDEIFRRVTAARKIAWEPGSPEYLRELCARSGHSDLYACYPNDICTIVIAINSYEQRPLQMGREDIERAVTLYFARS